MEEIRLRFNKEKTHLTKKNANNSDKIPHQPISRTYRMQMSDAALGMVEAETAYEQKD